eukprot:3858271-Prymnesium_polylepis.1
MGEKRRRANTSSNSGTVACGSGGGEALQGGRTSRASLRGGVVYLKSYNRANLTTSPLRASIRRAQNAQDERL